jgi:hypothetical protein
MSLAWDPETKRAGQGAGSTPTAAVTILPVTSVTWAFARIPLTWEGRPRSAYEEMED